MNHMLNCHIRLQSSGVCMSLYVCLPLCVRLNSVCLCVFQATVNKLVSVVLSVTKDIPLWTYSHLQYKQQQVLWSSHSSCFRHTCYQTANHIPVLFSLSLRLPGGAGGGSGCRRWHPGEAAGAEASGPTAGRAQRRHQVSPTIQSGMF